MELLQYHPKCDVTECDRPAWAWCWGHGVKKVPLCREGWRELAKLLRQRGQKPHHERIRFTALPFRGHPSQRKEKGNEVS
jgi:hypothetical protein